MPALGSPEQTDVGEHLEFEAQVARLPRRTIGGSSRCAIGARFEARIAEAAFAAFGHALPLSVFGQVTDQLARIDVMHDGAAGHAHVAVVAGFAGHVAAGTAFAVLCAKLPCNPKVRECVQRSIRDEENIAAIAAVATVRATLRNVFFAAKTQAAVATVAGLNSNRCFIDEFHTVGARHRRSPPCGRPTPVGARHAGDRPP